MITATYFGEITELGSRAVWYSDEEDDDDDDGTTDEISMNSPSKLQLPVRITSHETMRSNLSSTFRRIKPNPQDVKVTSCIISLSSSPHYKNFKINNDPNATLIGTFDKMGKVMIYPKNRSEAELWLMFDQSSSSINGQEVAYFVEALRVQLYSELKVDPSSAIIILSQQFSNSEHLEYLSNYTSPLIKLPFAGQPILPPALIKNQFESALFEQFTITLKPSYVVCLPDPKNYWFDKTKSWPTVANQIIEHKLSDDNLEKTLIFT